MDVIKLYNDFGIPYQSEGHKHCRPGWVNTPCPFCTGNPGLHLGVPLDGGPFVCWRCGPKPPAKAVAKLLNITEPKARSVIKQYQGQSVAKEIKRKPRKKSHKLPSNTTTLTKRHKQYLYRRNFDPEKLEREWKLMGTGPTAKLDFVDYKHRIVAPIVWNKEQVSFQARDITTKSPVKYKACPEERELIKHKHVLYGKAEKWSDTGICVEGITDVWRLGPKSFATFGIKYTKKQLRIISKSFSRVFVVFDDDLQAIEQANQLIKELHFRGVKAKRIDIKGDPGDMNQDEADYLVKNLLKN